MNVENFQAEVKVENLEETTIEEIENNSANNFSLASNSSSSSEVKREPETDHPEIPVQQIQAISSEGPMISAIDFTASTKNSINPMVPMGFGSQPFFPVSRTFFL